MPIWLTANGRSRFEGQNFSLTISALVASLAKLSSSNKNWSENGVRKMDGQSPTHVKVSQFQRFFIPNLFLPYEDDFQQPQSRVLDHLRCFRCVARETLLLTAHWPPKHPLLGINPLITLLSLRQALHFPAISYPTLTLLLWPPGSPSTAGEIVGQGHPHKLQGVWHHRWTSRVGYCRLESRCPGVLHDGATGWNGGDRNYRDWRINYCTLSGASVG